MYDIFLRDHIISGPLDLSLLLWLYSINADGLLASVANSQKTYLNYTYILDLLIVVVMRSLRYVTVQITKVHRDW